MGSLSRVEAETFGEPGQRTFRLNLDAGEAHCTVWLEKEQLFQLGVYLQDAVEAISEEEKGRESQPQEQEWSGGGEEVDFKAGQMLITHDKPANSFYLLAYERENPEAEPSETETQDPVSVSFSISPTQAQALSEDALRICAAGRPNCFLCGEPINPEGHVCPRSNGHTVLETG
ncbi:MAG: hypothetical protein BZY88_03245 [SAR202 cluster bacterium Io17-Chloro-G9]|nr:MAG: hypothetical protein BZY88_03245 [SAR202 cluster bacterium Io17-Chloro-G9]